MGTPGRWLLTWADAAVGIVPIFQECDVLSKRAILAKSPSHPARLVIEATFTV